ncbi:P-loop containing nucleoside triphosphate hydrolase protein [Epithele typhae]|uniref:P-loop containing nucleoside triphosphate hydrolase protein n=1 Tax=Epithele typhae TaxID=378194 RepID=UPI0020085748|nr:P-loop containing nucleoside triphosphate hydrolase protein [Epithele typhae]KAH9929015.1 P-loop containing nucleoside triphosphate hydrolase protein [Epithele typhae]
MVTLPWHVLCSLACIIVALIIYSVWSEERAVPLYGACASVLGLVIQLICERQFTGSAKGPVILTQRSEDEDAAGDGHPEYLSAFSRVVAQNGGHTRFYMKTARMVFCVALAALSVVPLVWSSSGMHFNPSHAQFLDGIYCALYIYASALSLGDILSAKHSSSFATHLVSVLLLSFGVSVYRNIVPLFVRGALPADAKEGTVLWIKLFLLFEAGIVIPLVIPRYDPSIENPNEQQRTSLLAYVMFTWLDSTVAKAARVPHLSLDDLPALSADNTAKELVDRSFQYVDPFKMGKDSHILWGFLRFYRETTGCCNCSSLTPKGFSVLEANGGNSKYQPWTWVVLMFVCASLYTLADQWYLWIVVGGDFSRHEDPSSPNGNSGKGNLGDVSTTSSRAIWKTSGSGNLLDAHLTDGFGTVHLRRTRSDVRDAIPTHLSQHVLALLSSAKMAKMDARVQLISEVLGVVRMIKLFGWETHATEQIAERRKEELVQLRKTRMMELYANITTFTIPLFAMAITFTSYTILQKGELTPSRLFPALSAFLMIQSMQFVFNTIPAVLRGKVSIDRINDFLHTAELLDEFEHPQVQSEDAFTASDTTIDIGIEHTVFTWSSSTPASGAQTPVDPTSSTTLDARHFALRIDEPLCFKRGAMNLIVGPTGSGKTSLLMALLGEMHASPSQPGLGTCVRLPREGGVAYAAQESWIQNETIRDNILFGSPFDEVRYNKVIKQCALERDLTLFAAGDKTEVGEKGITLSDLTSFSCRSGGQKARITLARAVYSKAEILLLDDVLAALEFRQGAGSSINVSWAISCADAPWSSSHNVALTRPVADFVVALGSGGRIASQGSLDKALQEDKELMEELKAEVAKAEQEVDDPVTEEKPSVKDDGKLTIAEEISEGSVAWSAMNLFFANTSSHLWLFWTLYPLAFTVVHSMLNMAHSRSSPTNPRNGSWECGRHNTRNIIELKFTSDRVVLYSVGWFWATTGSLRASAIVHKRLLASVLGTTLRWLDMTPTSRIITRCTTDIQSIDNNIFMAFHQLLEHTGFMLSKLVAVTIIIPLFVLPAALLFAVGGWFSTIYMRAELPIKREMSNAQAPVLGHFSGAIAGLVSIRAYGAQESFRLESYRRMDNYSRAAFPFNALTRWVTIRVNILGTALTTALAAYLTYSASIGAANSGFSLSMASNRLEKSRSDLERIQQYLVIEQEPKPTKSGVPPAYWPASGELRVENLSARYTPDGPKVLHDLSFQVKSGERIGIVGRTGSGKSSLTLSLLRAIYTEGSVFYDGLATDALNLDALRSNVTIIPQVPDLLSGTLRQNLDPYDEHSDVTLNDALRSAGLFALQERVIAGSSDDHIEGRDSARLDLDSEIAGGGGNLSVGQRQIIALARAIVRRSKLLILDEATSAIDYETDAIIQKSLREELGKDVTVLTVAHRLQSIMDADKIMVLDAGHIVEFDSPRVLLENNGGFFRGLVDGSMDRATLYATAGIMEC